MNVHAFPLNGMTGRKGPLYWLLLGYSLLFVAMMIAAYIRGDEPLIPMWFFFLSAQVLWACMPVAVVIDEESGRLRWAVAFGRVITRGRPLSEYIRATKDEHHRLRVRIEQGKRHIFVEVHDPEAFCEALNEAIGRCHE